MSCFRHIRTVSTLSFLLLMLGSIILIPTQFCYGSSQADAVSDDSSAEVNALIRDLRSPKFAVREAATQRLIEVGSPAIAALQLATESDSLEVRVRAQSILGRIQQTRDSSFGSSEQATIKQFKEAAAASRVAILRAIAKPDSTSLFLHLLDIVIADEEKSTNDNQEESPIETLIADETLKQLISGLLDTSNWSGIEKVLTHPGILKYSPLLRVIEAQQAGKFEAYIEDQFQKLSQAHAAKQKTSTRELASLIGLLRVQRDFERAETVIGWLPDVELQRTIRSELLFQQGDWQEVLRRTKLDPDDPDFISANLKQEALLHHFMGDKVAVDEIKQQLRQELEAATKETATEEAESAEEEAESVKLIRANLRIVGAITLDWPLVAEFLEPDNLASNVGGLIALNRASEALELLEIGPDFKSRHAWMETTLKELEEAQEKMNKRLSSRRDEESIALQQLIDEKSGLASAVAEIMEQRGMDDEAQLYYQMIYSAESGSNSGSIAILNQLAQLGRTDDYWQLVDSILRDPNQPSFSIRSGLGVQSATVKSLAGQWANRIRGAIIDPLDQTKTIAAVMNSPLVDREELDFDLDFEIARFRSQFGLYANGSDEFTLAQVFELNGQDQQASQMLQQAALLGSTGAIQRSYEHAVAAKDNRGILKFWSDAYNRPTETCLAAEQAALKLLESETDPDQIKNIKRQLKICRLAIAAQWIGARSRRGYSQSYEMDDSHLAIFRLQCMVYGVSGDTLDKRYQHNQLGSALISEKSNQESQGGIELATVMFNELAFAAGGRGDLSWSYTSMRLNLALARGMIQRGEYDKAADWLIRLVQFSPGDVSVGESTVKKLDQAGETEAADRIYQAVEKYFVESLEMYPESPLNRNNYAWLSATSNRDLQMAKRHALVAVKVRPNVEQYLDTLAEIEFLLGRPKEAFELSKRCVQLNPSRNYYREQKERFRKAMTAAE